VKSHKQYNLASAVDFCFRYALKAVSLKLLIEIINGALVPLMVLVVASFINNAIAYVNGESGLAPLVMAIVLTAVYYAYSQSNQIALRLADKTLENALKENLRPQLIQKHSRISFSLLENPETIDLISRVCENVEGRLMSVLNSGIRIIRLGIQIFGILSLLAVHIWWFLPLFAVVVVPILLIARKGGKSTYLKDAAITNLTRRQYYLSNVLVGRETAAERTLFGYAGHMNDDFSATHLKRSNMNTMNLVVEQVTVNACGLIVNLVVIAAVFALLVPVGEHTMSHGLYVSLIGALLGLAKTITGAVSRLMRDTSEQIEYMKDFTQFFALPEMDSKITNNSGGKALTFERLEIRNLRFRYTPDGHYVLDGVTLIIEKDKSYSLIGQNGVGKNTLTKILLGLYRDFEGEIMINGIDIAEYDTDKLRRIFSVVYQDFAKYYVTFENNIKFGNEHGNFDSALCLVELTGVVSKLPQKEHTPLGKIYDDGVDISVGEWQKVAIARELYANTPFMILDEPTASLSPMMESTLYKRFVEITKNKTSLLISHRLGSTKLSDVLFVLDNGIIAETGTHDDLMAANGIYAEMFNNQRSWYDER
jgi:ATP-binding cassette subfamily B protein